jgi:serine/threonine protein kinase/tetratricopeptide (TPR) repeat protein
MVKITGPEWKQMFELLDTLFELPEADHAAFLARIDGGAPDLGEKLRHLLRQGENFPSEEFASSALSLCRENVSESRRRFAQAATLTAGAEIGPYRLIREIGYGGMSAVWLAVRSDRLMQRNIALKLPHAFTRDARFADRFARECDLLAALTHVNIARLYDAGFSAGGQPYLAMEYVEGESLLAFCNKQRLEVRARLQLFLQVLAAVQYAHSQLIIHRDLKPSNILVTAQHQVRLLDFGIAKLMFAGETRETELTQIGGRALTPDYASPEQIAGRTLGTGTDVYSLGVVLYELLTGRRPYNLRRDSRGALEDAILDSDSPHLAPSVISGHAENCSASRAALEALLRGDLDSIVLKTLKKLPADRYGTADALAQDLGRYLRQEPVFARPDSARYRIRKFLRRNRLMVAGTTAIALMLLVGITVALWQANAARRESRRAEAVQNFLLDIFRTNSADQPDPLKGRQTTAEQLLNAGAERVGASLRNSPEAQEKVLDTLADMYYELGLEDRAGDMRRQRIEVLKSIYGDQDLRVVDALLSYATDLDESSTHHAELVPITAAKAILDARHDADSPLRGRLLLQMARFNRHSAITQSRDYADQAVAIFEGNDPNDNLIESLRFAGQARLALGDYSGAKFWSQRGRAEVTRRHPGEAVWMLAPLGELAEAEYKLLQLGEAERHFRECLSMARTMNGDRHPETLWMQIRTGVFLHDTGRRPEGRELLEEARSISHGGGGHETVEMSPFSLGDFAAVDLAEGRIEDAEPYLIDYLAHLRQQYAGSRSLARALALQGRLWTALGRYPEATASLQEALEMWHSAAGSGAAAGSDNQYLLAQARLALATGETTTALERLQGVTGLNKPVQLPLWLDYLGAMSLRARAELHQGRLAEATEDAMSAATSLQQSPLRRFYPVLEAEVWLVAGQIEQATGQLGAARTHLVHALELRQANDDATSPWLAEAQIALADCLVEQAQIEDAKRLLSQARRILTGHKMIGRHFSEQLQATEAHLEQKAARRAD